MGIVSDPHPRGIQRIVKQTHEGKGIAPPQCARGKRASLCVAEAAQAERCGIGNRGVPYHPVFFVRAANKGVKLDRARKSGKCRT